MDKSLHFTDIAFMQIKLILEQDYTLEGHYFRIKIDGKGCDGFKYACGFTPREEGDVECHFTHPTLHQKLFYLMDTFTDYYLKHGEVDYLLNTETYEEGFIITNFDEKKYYGKFFKNTEMVPHHLKG